ncbi:MAG: class I SAM-dependent methyltransferase [Oscillibacter sp.]|nr:class I SAM-dependent methyltransferase [Oscillibacter sp.]
MEILTAARSTILRGCEDFQTNRARINKFRESNPQKAQDAFNELDKTRKKLLEALANAQQSLREMEQDRLADYAGKLRQGLAGFNLMTRDYAPVNKLLTDFAEKLPETEDSVNAAVIGRLMNRVRMGYYPTDPANIDLILRGIQFPQGVTTNVFDPCCGCGKALRQIANGHNCYAFGIELDEHRAEEAQSRLHRVGVGSFFHSRTSGEAFHVLFLNPPYLSVIGENGTRTRHEKRFLVDSIRNLMVGGVLIYVIPFYRLTADVCRILSDNYENLGVWRFTDPEFARFKQVAVIGTRKKRSEDPETAAALEKLSCDPQTIPLLTEIEEGRYLVPSTPKKVEVFKGEKFNEKELERQLAASDSFRRLMNARSELDSAEKRPLLPLSIGQIGLVGGSGLINGLIDCDTPHIIKGRIIKVCNVEREAKFNGRGDLTGAEIKEVISNKMVFNVLTSQGFKALA